MYCHMASISCLLPDRPTSFIVHARNCQNSHRNLKPFTSTEETLANYFDYVNQSKKWSREFFEKQREQTGRGSFWRCVDSLILGSPLNLFKPSADTAAMPHAPHITSHRPLRTPLLVDCSLSLWISALAQLVRHLIAVKLHFLLIITLQSRLWRKGGVLCRLHITSEIWWRKYSQFFTSTLKIQTFLKSQVA